MDWQPIPEVIDTSKPPFNGDDVLVWADSACVNIVRLASWREPDPDLGDDEDDRGWWSYRHSVTQERLDFLTPTYWAEFKQPAPLADEIVCAECGGFHMSHHRCTRLAAQPL